MAAAKKAVNGLLALPAELVSCEIPSIDVAVEEGVLSVLVALLFALG
jgi:hypothetical protein